MGKLNELWSKVNAERDNAATVSGAAYYAMTLDNIIEASNLPQEEFDKSGVGPSEYLFSMLSSSLEAAFLKLCASSDGELGVDILKCIPDEYHKLQKVLEMFRKRACIKDEQLAELFKVKIMELGIEKTANTIKEELIASSISKAFDFEEENPRPKSSTDNSDVDWYMVKEYYKDIRENKLLIVYIRALGAVINATKYAGDYGCGFTEYSAGEFDALLKRAFCKFYKAKSLEFDDEKENNLSALPEDLRRELAECSSGVLSELNVMARMHYEQYQDPGVVNDFWHAIDDLNVKTVRKKLKKFLINKFIKEARNG